MKIFASWNSWYETHKLPEGLSTDLADSDDFLKEENSPLVHSRSPQIKHFLLFPYISDVLNKPTFHMLSAYCFARTWRICFYLKGLRYRQCVKGLLA